MIACHTCKTCLELSHPAVRGLLINQVNSLRARLVTVQEQFQSHRTHARNKQVKKDKVAAVHALGVKQCLELFDLECQVNDLTMVLNSLR